MKIKLIVLISVLVATACLVGCATPATQPTPTQAPPTQPPVSQKTPQHKLNAEIVQKMVDKLNAGDLEGSLAYFTDDARIYLYT